MKDYKVFTAPKRGFYHVDVWVAFSAGPREKAVLRVHSPEGKGQKDDHREFGNQTLFDHVAFATGDVSLTRNYLVCVHLQAPFTHAMFCFHKLPAHSKSPA